MIYQHKINGLDVKTGDIICTTDGGSRLVAGEFWRLIGKLIPGDVDHVAIYLGPEGRCVEAGPHGVFIFDVPDGVWDSGKMLSTRGIADTLFGIAYPLNKASIEDATKDAIREGVAAYCMKQANAHKPYNLNFLDSETEDRFYCSQLAYKAYKPFGINLNTGIGCPQIPGTVSIIFPQELWEGCSH